MTDETKVGPLLPEDGTHSDDVGATKTSPSKTAKKKKLTDSTKQTIPSSAIVSTSETTRVIKKKKKASKKATGEEGENEESNDTNSRDAMSCSTEPSKRTSSGKKKKKTPKKISRSVSDSASVEFPSNIRDSISCLTDNTTSSKKSKRKKPKAPKNTTGGSSFTTEETGSSSSVHKHGKPVAGKKSNHVADLDNDDDDDVEDELSCLTGTSSTRKDKLRRSTTNKISVRSMASSATSGYFSRSDDDDEDYDHGVNKTEGKERDDDNNDGYMHSQRSRSRSTSHNYRVRSKSKSKLKKKKSNRFGDGTVKLKILPDGTTRVSVPRQNSEAIQVAATLDRDKDSESDESDSDEDIPTVLTKRSLSPQRLASKSPSARRSKSADFVSEMAAAASKHKRKSAKKIRSLSKDINTANNSGATVNTQSTPVRFAARRQPSKIRSVSADQLWAMRMSTNKMQNVSPPRGPPPQRGINRHTSEPFAYYGGRHGEGRGKEGGGRGHGQGRGRGRGRGPPKQRSIMHSDSNPMRSQEPLDRSSSFTPNRPKENGNKPKRNGSKTMTTTEHIGLLHKEIIRRPPRRSSSEDFAMRNTKERKNTRVKSGGRSLSPTRQVSSTETPKSILRNSSHHRNSSDDLTKVSNHSALSATSSHSVEFASNVIYSSDVDDDDISSSEEFNDDDGDNYSDSIYEVINDMSNNDSKHNSNNTNRKTQATDLSQTASRRKNGLKRGLSAGSFFGFSGRSFKTNRSQLSIEREEGFEDDSWWKASLRYLRLLPPHKEETSMKKKIRIFTWTAMLLDFVAAMVAVVQYDGSTECCGEPIFDILLDINWDVLFRVVTLMYLLLIFAEIIPVIKQGIPFNIVNPTVGFIITFGMFFDDSVMEAVVMWVIEAMAIFFEFLVYRVNARIYFETCFKLKQVDEDLEKLKKSRRRLLDLSRHSAMSNSQNSSISDGDMSGRRSTHRSKIPFEIPLAKDADDDSLSGHSFGDDEGFDDEESFREDNKSSIRVRGSPRYGRLSQSGRISNLERAKSKGTIASSKHSSETGGRRLAGEIKQNRLLRKRRVLRENKKREEKELHYHFIGTILNVGLAVFALVFIITIAATGGLCFKNDEVKFFSFDQLGRCNACSGGEECMRCDLPEGNQCYYPYY